MTHPVSSASTLSFLNLPPIQDPSLSTVPSLSSRPRPLEPRTNDSVNTDVQTKRPNLTGRQKALAQAQPLDISISTEPDPPSLEQESRGNKSRLARPAVPDPEQARKKAKLGRNEQIADFVQLPKLQPTKPNVDKKPLFRPIGMLNELNEPPPSAGLFPPITPRPAQVQDRQGGSNGSARKEHEEIQKKSKTAPTALAEGQTPQEKKKKVCLRERVKWTEEEAEQLVKGVAIYGMGRWKNILEHPEFDFHPARTHVDLKDKFRVLFPPKAPHKWVRSMPEHISDEELEFGSSGISTQKPHLRARKRVWTITEDEEMDKGFQKHGYRWEVIAKDPDLQFDNRSGAQIRDRFRLRFPELYAQQASNTSESYTTAEIRDVEDEGQQQRQGKTSKNTSARKAKPKPNIHKDDSCTSSSDPVNAPTPPPSIPPSTSSARWTATIAAPIQVPPTASAPALALPPTMTTTTTTLPGSSGPDWLNGLLNGGENGDENIVDHEMRLTNAMSQIDCWDDVAMEESLTLPPLVWEDMVPSSMFWPS